MLVEDCAEDFSFLLHIPRDGNEAEILPQVTLADRMDAALSGGLGQSGRRSSESTISGKKYSAEVLSKLGTANSEGSGNSALDTVRLVQEEIRFALEKDNIRLPAEELQEKMFHLV